jgi:hypothetical protein
MPERFTETLRAASEVGWSHAVQHRFVNELFAGAVPAAVMAHRARDSRRAGRKRKSRVGLTARGESQPLLGLPITVLRGVHTRSIFWICAIFKFVTPAIYGVHPVERCCNSELRERTIAPAASRSHGPDRYQHHG